MLNQSNSLIELNNKLNEILEDQSLSETERDILFDQVLQQRDAANDNFKEMINEYIAYVKEMTGLADSRKQQANQLKNLAKTDAAKAARVRKYLTNELLSTETNTVDVASGRVTLRKKPPKVDVLVPVEELPAEYKRVKEEADLTALKDALREGIVDPKYAEMKTDNGYSIMIN